MVHLYTRSGDSGETWCFALGEGGKPVRVPKDHPLIEFLGTLDEANSLIGLARSFLSSKGLDARVNGDLKWIQRLLFNVGFTLSSREPKVAEEDLEKLERIADSYYGEPLRRFILPAGSPKVAALHTARTAVRRAERRLVSAVKSGITVDPLVLKIINRASDALFAMAIALARAEGGLEEV